MKNARFFAAMNTGNGFRSYFEETFGGAERRYVIKGGPGTGKSSLMKKVAVLAEERGFTCERYYCSSDPSSLDGLIIKELGAALIDGTSPHTYDPKYPGVRDFLVDLGRNWDVNVLSESGDEAIRLSDAKKAGYSKLYSFLSLARQCEAGERSLCRPSLDLAKFCAFIERKTGRTSGKAARPSLRITQGFAPGGRIRLGAFDSLAGERYVFTDPFGSAPLLLSCALDLLSERGAEVLYSPYFLCPALPCEIFLPGRKVLLRAGVPGEGDTVVNSRRFLDKKSLSVHLKTLRYLGKCASSFEKRAEETFAETKEAHFALEKLYVRAMDFSANDVVVSDISSELFSL